MSKMRHKKTGASVGNEMDGEKESKGSKPVKAYDAKGSEVEKEAKKRAFGGKVEGDKPKHRMDRPKRKDGGRVGADKSPLSSANKVRGASGHSTDDV